MNPKNKLKIITHVLAIQATVPTQVTVLTPLSPEMMFGFHQETTWNPNVFEKNCNAFTMFPNGFQNIHCSRL